MIETDKRISKANTFCQVSLFCFEKLYNVHSGFLKKSYLQKLSFNFDKMETHRIIETIGAVAKEEKLVSLLEQIMPNTLVLETGEPYPGYHGANLPTEPSPVSVFLVTRKKYSTVRILRTSSNIRKYFDHYFDAAAGVICFGNNIHYCIRIKDLDNYQLIGKLQESFTEEGIQFARSKNVSATAIIKLKKPFIIEELEKGIYRDVMDPSMHYLSIPKQINWQIFARITGIIKNNIDNANFDAAIAAIYASNILDVVRIYAKEISLEKLRWLKSKYSEEIIKLV